MKAILLLFVGLNTIAAASAASEWVEQGVTLKWGESFSFYDYNIKAMDFRPGTIEENPKKCKNETNSINRKIYGCDDWVFLKISRDGNHILDAALAKENHTYADGGEFYNETTYEDDENLLRIIAQDVITGSKIPTPYAELKLMIKKKEDEFDIAKNLTITRMVSREAHVNPCNQFISVEIIVKNIGVFDFSFISVEDRAGDGFISEPDDLNWSISIGRGGMWQTEYKIKPLQPVSGAEFKLPPAMLYINYHGKKYNLSTGDFSFILRSSDIILSKTADVNPEGIAAINLSVKNNGSRASIVKVWDSLLPGMEVVTGNTNFSIVLQPGISYNQSYMIKVNNISDNISLPPANFTFDEYRPCYDTDGDRQITGSGISNPVQIKFKEAAQVQVTSTLPPSVEETPIEISPDGEATTSENLISGALSVSGYQIPYTYLLILAGVLLVLVIAFTLKVWKLLGLFR